MPGAVISDLTSQWLNSREAAGSYSIKVHPGLNRWSLWNQLPSMAMVCSKGLCVCLGAFWLKLLPDKWVFIDSEQNLHFSSFNRTSLHSSSGSSTSLGCFVHYQTCCSVLHWVKGKLFFHFKKCSNLLFSYHSVQLHQIGKAFQLVTERKHCFIVLRNINVILFCQLSSFKPRKTQAESALYSGDRMFFRDTKEIRNRSLFLSHYFPLPNKKK